MLESSGEYIEYWEDALCCTADALMKSEYDPEEDEVVLPNKYERDGENYEATYVHQEENR